MTTPSDHDSGRGPDRTHKALAGPSAEKVREAFEALPEHRNECFTRDQMNLDQYDDGLLQLHWQGFRAAIDSPLVKQMIQDAVEAERDAIERMVCDESDAQLVRGETGRVEVLMRLRSKIRQRAGGE